MSDLPEKPVTVVINIPVSFTFYSDMPDGFDYDLFKFFLLAKLNYWEDGHGGMDGVKDSMPGKWAVLDAIRETLRKKYGNEMIPSGENSHVSRAHKESEEIFVEHFGVHDGVHTSIGEAK